MSNAVVDISPSGSIDLLPATNATGTSKDTGGHRFRFRPGQWVDFFIPTVQIVGGYSICSPPGQLPELELCVKYVRDCVTDC